MQVWLPALTGAKRVPDKNNPTEWAECEPQRFRKDTVTIVLQGRPYIVRRRYLREGKCSQCGGWVYEDRPYAVPRFCSDVCQHGHEVARGLA